MIDPEDLGITGCTSGQFLLQYSLLKEEPASAGSRTKPTTAEIGANMAEHVFHKIEL